MIRIEDKPQLCKRIAEAFYNLVKDRDPETRDQDPDSSFYAWTIGPVTITSSWTRGAGSSLAVQTDPDVFYVSYDRETKNGLMTIGLNPWTGWDFGGGVDDPRY